MVLILSAKDDFSTNDVINWLVFMDKKFIRISEEDEIQFSKIEITNENIDLLIIINNKIEIKLSEINRFWYRRSSLNIFIEKLQKNTILNSKVNNHLFLEGHMLQIYFINEIKNKSLNIPSDNYLNKLIVLREAVELEINVPKTLVTNSKKELLSFYSAHKKLITKNISPGVFITEQNKVLSTITERVSLEDITHLPERFAYSLFQEEIKKMFELRIFFIEDNFYASAIFSQNDKKTEVDFRNYNFEKPNRTPPFKLPRSIEKKLNNLMKKIKLNSGSIDLIYSNDGKYYFLEVNPIGQFYQVSNPCNYYLEKKIAEFL